MQRPRPKEVRRTPTWRDWCPSRGQLVSRLIRAVLPVFLVPRLFGDRLNPTLIYSRTAYLHTPIMSTVARAPRERLPSLSGYQYKSKTTQRRGMPPPPPSIAPLSCRHLGWFVSENVTKFGMRSRISGVRFQRSSRTGQCEELWTSERGASQTRGPDEIDTHLRNQPRRLGSQGKPGTFAGL